MPRLTCALILIGTLCLSPMALAAGPDTGLPDDALLAPTYEWTDGAWVETSDAVSYNSGTTNGHCNRECWDVTIENRVSVAQWIEWDVQGTRRDWRVLKPGAFAQTTVKARVRSNDAVHISLWMDNPADASATSLVPPIERWFSHGASDSLIEAERHTWKHANDYSAAEPFSLIIPDGSMLRNGLAFNVWELIEITDRHRATDYYGTGSMLICVSNLMHWVDADVGGFDQQRNPGLVL